MKLMPIENYEEFLSEGLNILRPRVLNSQITFISGKNAQKKTCSSLDMQIDTGADASFITPSVLDSLNIKQEDCWGKICGGERFLYLYLDSSELEVNRLFSQVAIREISKNPLLMIGLPEIQKITDAIEFNWEERTWEIQKKNH